MHRGSLLFIGNATTLIRYGEFTLLTDPNFLHRGQRAYLGYGITSRRRTEPAVSPAELPALDAIVLSHLHGDHFDRVARRSLDRRVPIITNPHAARRLQGWHRFSRAVGLRTWESHVLLKNGETLRVTALPGQHAPGAVRHLLPPVMGSMLEFGRPSGEVDFRLYITGDTLLVDALREIPQRYPDIPLALLHLGRTTLPGGLVVTMDTQQGCDLLELVRPRQAVPIHLDDYAAFTFSIADFRDEVTRRGLGDRVGYVEPGQTMTFGATALPAGSVP